MIKKIIFSFLFLLSLNANEDLTAQKQNTLYVQNLIEREEKIAKNFEKYILTEFALPSISDLIDDKYLGSNFPLENRMGVDIGFSNTKTLQLKYLISRAEYNKIDDYIVQLYNRDLYRNFTNVNFKKDDNNIKIVDLTNSYVEMKLQSDEAKTIFELLKNDKSIQQTCSSPEAGKYCNNSAKTIRWYNSTSEWIEYSKKDFEKGNVILSSESLLTNTRLEALPVGTYIFIAGVKYVKLINDSSNNLQILKVK